MKKAIDILVGIVGWGAALILVALAVRIFVFDQFSIPSDSMEPTLIPGDHILVNKLVFGARIYKNFDFLEGKEMESWRTWGWRKIRRNDVVVFNYPWAHSKKGISFAIDKVYVKRCIGLPGDTLSIRNGIYCNPAVPDSTLGYLRGQLDLSRTRPEDLDPKVLRSLKRGEPETRWNIKELGPLYIPRRGGTVELDSTNYKLYGSVIRYETGNPLVYRNGKLFAGDREIRSYTFLKDYYFMGGDNVLNSRDSRYWGFLPEEYIIGVATRVLYSENPHTEDIRWKRTLKKLK